MQLRTARLCLDCEEIHDQLQCPVCASESIAFLTRWVPAPERRARPRPVEPTDPEGLDTYKQLLDSRRQTGWKIARTGAVGLAVVGLASWLWRRSETSATSAAARPTTGSQDKPAQPKLKP